MPIPSIKLAASLLFAAVFSLLFGCGKFDRIENGGTTQVTFRKGAERFSPMATLTGGIVVYLYSPNFITNVKLDDETGSATLAVPNGQYSFYAYGYGYSFATSGTDVRCAVVGDPGPMDLVGEPRSVTLTMATSNCSHGTFVSSAAALDTSTQIFAQLQTVHCGSAAGTNLSTIAATQDCSTMAGTGITAPWSAVSRHQVVVPIFRRENGVYVRMGEAFRTPCTNISNVSGSQATSDYARVPYGNTDRKGLFPIEMVTYSDTSCATPPLSTHEFSEGLVFGPSNGGTESARIIPTTTLNRIRVFLRQP